MLRVWFNITRKDKLCRRTEDVYKATITECKRIMRGNDHPQDVAKKLGMGWDTVKSIRKEHLSRKYSKIELKDLKILALDEIAIQKGHKYITIVMDLESGAIVFVGDGKGAESLEPFWKKLKTRGHKNRSRINRYVTCLHRSYNTEFRDK